MGRYTRWIKWEVSDSSCCGQMTDAPQAEKKGFSHTLMHLQCLTSKIKHTITKFEQIGLHYHDPQTYWCWLRSHTSICMEANVLLKQMHQYSIYSIFKAYETLFGLIMPIPWHKEKGFALSKLWQVLYLLVLLLLLWLLLLFDLVLHCLKIITRSKFILKEVFDNTSFKMPHMWLYIQMQIMDRPRARPKVFFPAGIWWIYLC